MSDPEDIEQKIRQAETGPDTLKDHVSSAALEVAQSSASADADSTPAVGTTERHSAEQDAKQADRSPRATSRQAATLAQAGVDWIGEGVRAGPLQTLAVAALVGVGIGWLVRGAFEEEHRSTWRALLTELSRQRRD